MIVLTILGGNTSFSLYGNNFRASQPLHYMKADPCIQLLIVFHHVVFAANTHAYTTVPILVLNLH